MADAKISALTAVTTPAGTDQFVVNQGGTSKQMTLAQINDYTDPVMNAAAAAQGPGFAADTYVTASRIVLPQARMQAGCVYRARMVFTKTDAGTATPTFTLRTGTAGTTSDTSRLAYTGVAQTAVADTAYLEFQATFRVVGASAVLASWLRFDHDLASTGFANATRGFQGQAVSSTFDSTTASMGIGSVRQRWGLCCLDLAAVLRGACEPGGLTWQTSCYKRTAPTATSLRTARAFSCLSRPSRNSTVPPGPMRQRPTTPGPRRLHCA